MHPDVRELPVGVLYRDEWLVVIDKPSGMLVHRSPGARDPIVVLFYVRDLIGGYAWPVHRLDRDTSGAVMVAIDAEAARRMTRLFVKGRVDKTYLAVVAGEIAASGRIDTPLIKPDGTPQEAVTEFTRLAVCNGRSLLRVSLLTGRRHQIRRHLQSVGNPVLGDRLYGDEALNATAAQECGVTRLALHASRLACVHPMTRVPLEVEAALPKELADAWTHMGFPSRLGRP